jgi:prolyl-tRNA editing enzyme YbaK/EbsC (Cys-tRNA(Pro) deacylase)
MSWSEVNNTYASDQTPTERAFSAVADRHGVALEQLQSTVVRARDDGMAVVVEQDD